MRAAAGRVPPRVQGHPPPLGVGEELPELLLCGRDATPLRVELLVGTFEHAVAAAHGDDAVGALEEGQLGLALLAERERVARAELQHTFGAPFELEGLQGHPLHLQLVEEPTGQVVSDVAQGVRLPRAGLPVAEHGGVRGLPRRGVDQGGGELEDPLLAAGGAQGGVGAEGLVVQLRRLAVPQRAAAVHDDGGGAAARCRDRDGLEVADTDRIGI
mmetsp:Transcript_61514/g.198039  ORF Transcript_61514/g.198039 Transcript_61514/m.198039 type:complete len:215 (-) Transcript_61514:688-1332(-)